MSANKPDILQIRKYLNGELDAHAMYELERRAQNDPFLMDVIKGMESGSENHQPNLDAIERLIQQRVQQDKKRVIPIYKYWPAAACLLIALGIGGWWLTRQTPKPLVAVNVHPMAPVDKAQEPKPPSVAAPIVPAVKPAVIARNRVPEVKASGSSALTAIKQAPPQRESVFKSDTVDYKIADYKPQPNKTVDNVLREVRITNIGAQKSGDTIALNKTAEIANADAPRTITGKIVDKKNGVLLPGVPIIINGTDQGIKTNADGSFAAVMRARKATIAVSKEGYEPQQVKVKDQDNLEIELVPDNKALSKAAINRDVVQKRVVKGGVGAIIGNNLASSGTKPDSLDELLKKMQGVEVGNDGTLTHRGQQVTKARLNGKDYAGGDVAQATKNLPADIIEKVQVVDDYADQAAKKGVKGTAAKPMPVIGWKQYQAYLDRAAVMPNGATGEITADVNIAPGGKIHSIQITNSNRAMLNKAMQIIKNGPKWIGDTKSKTVRLKIVFHK